MSDTIGPDGLTEVERWQATVLEKDGMHKLWTADFQDALRKLAAERLAHAETRARAEKAEAQGARMREVLTDWAAIINDQGQCIACRRGPVDDHAADCIVAELLREK